MTRRFPRVLNNLMVSVAGPLMNLLLAVAISVALVALAKTGHIDHALAAQIVRFMVVLNISLMFFNLLPIPPLDGGAILAVILPERLATLLLPPLQRYGMLIILILFVTPLGSLLMRPAGRLAAAWSEALMQFVPG
jgi:Zn-dependent protease